MKNILMSLILLFCSNILAGGDNVGNGGDPCENRFQLVRDDLRAWINQGGPARFKFPTALTLEDYTKSMLNNLNEAKVSCTDETVKVGQAEKTCRNFFDAQNLPVIICNRTRLLEASQDNQYVLVHHEYAGLAGLETNVGEVSDYRISNQVSSFLENQIIKKLVVKTRDPFQLELYDISILLPKILAPESLTSFALKPTDVGGYGVLLPKEKISLLDPFFTSLGDVTGALGSRDGLKFLSNKGSFNYSSFYSYMEAMALRIVPCTSNALALNPDCKHHIRIVWQLQPSKNYSSVSERLNQEAALHAAYDITQSDLVVLIQKLKKLKASVEVPDVSGGLWVNPYLEQRRLGSAYAKELFTIFKSFIGEKRISQVTFTRYGWSEYVTEGTWYFSGINFINGKAKTMTIPRINAEIQFYTSTRSEQGAFWGLMSPVAPELKTFNRTWRDDNIIRNLTEDQIMAGGRAAQRTQNPKFHDGENTDCASCHAAQPTRQWFGENFSWINLSKKFPDDEYQNQNQILKNATPQFMNDNGSAATIRQFGYVGQNAFVSQRVINESADALDFILQSNW